MQSLQSTHTHLASSSPLRLITATSIFDGHDASINIVRRMLQDQGVEVIHLGFNRSVHEVVTAALQEDVHGIAISSYQGGHVHYLEYLLAQLQANKASHIQVFAGGGGTITSEEARHLEKLGVNRVYTSEDGLNMSLTEMVVDIIDRLNQTRQPCSPNTLNTLPEKNLTDLELGRIISQIECFPDQSNRINTLTNNCFVMGITGTGGAGKSTFIDELIHALLGVYPNIKIAYLAVDPSRQKTGGALLGDRIRINTLPHPRVFMRSLATRQSNVSISQAISNCIPVLKQQDFDLILIESAGIGQSDISILEPADFSLYLMTKEYGSPSQLEKIEMLQHANAVLLNKADQRGAEDAFRDIKKQWQRNFNAFDGDEENIPVFPMVASHHSDQGFNSFIRYLTEQLPFEKNNKKLEQFVRVPYQWSKNKSDIKLETPNYLAEIDKTFHKLTKEAQQQVAIANKIQAYYNTLSNLKDTAQPPLLEPYQAEAIINSPIELQFLQKEYNTSLESLTHTNKLMMKQWLNKAHSSVSTKNKESHDCDEEKEKFASLSGLRLPFVSLPDDQHIDKLLHYLLEENLPGHYPYTAGVFPTRNTSEDPTRMFAGEGTPEDTNRRFHFLIKGQKSIRLSTAFDPNTLYGQNPIEEADVMGCIGMSGVSIATLDDMKKLYSGIDLCANKTSVSMTINGPAPILMAWFLHTAIDQQIEIHLKKENLWVQAQHHINEYFQRRGYSQPEYLQSLPSDHNKLGLALLGISGETLLNKMGLDATYQAIKAHTFKSVRGTLQADILKEEIAQNECIFSLDFSLTSMSDLLAYFIDESIDRFYSVSVSGYHIAEAGANPVTQLAFTLANGFTLIEYFLAKGLNIDDIAPHLSFFFSNGMDPEYAVIGRVARRIWARTLKHFYHANDRSQKLKYHIQTSGRSLHAQEIDLNDIRTTLQAIYALYDNCNSLHTNAYDEAITTPTEESVYRALSIQSIINREYGLNKSHNPLQGSYLIRDLTHEVEKAVYEEFKRLDNRGGVFGAFETGYQRQQIQDQSYFYEKSKNSGQLEIVGVNTLVRRDHAQPLVNKEIIRCSDERKLQQVEAVRLFQDYHADESALGLSGLKSAVSAGGNTFFELMKVAPVCSLAELSGAFFELGGKYRRSM